MNGSIIDKANKDIDRLYDEAQEEGQYSNKMEQFERLLKELPDRIWIE